MSMEFFTAEQKDLIPEYQAKWKKIALSTQRIDRDKAKEAMIKAHIKWISCMSGSSVLPR